MLINPYPSVSLEAATLYCQAHPELVVGLTSGSFDLFHDYHLRYLIQCKRRCGILVVGVDSDDAVRQCKGADRPIQSEFQRLMLVNANKAVTFAYIQDGVGDFTRVAEALLARGGKAFRNQVFAGRENEVALGKVQGLAKVEIIPDIEETSSTSAIVRKVNGIHRLEK